MNVEIKYVVKVHLYHYADGCSNFYTWTDEEFSEEQAARDFLTSLSTDGGKGTYVKLIDWNGFVNAYDSNIYKRTITEEKV